MPVPACFLCHLDVLCLLDPCLPKLLAWQLESVVVTMMSVQVCSESTGHAEYSEPVKMLFSRHNPTTPNRTGIDVGTQYRCGIYYHKKEQKQVPPSFFLSVDPWINIDLSQPTCCSVL